ncbi:MAG: elongation factor P--(R)-beta-lysine ligase [Gammaproteobacteria bacterium]
MEFKYLMTTNWQPTSTIATLRARAQIIANIRKFFNDRQLLEVETPLLSHATVTDPHVIGIPALCRLAQKEQWRYLQTSPEYAMKRLLAAGSGSIYQICKAFRQGDFGKLHNPEFTMLEWYRVGFDHKALMDEMDELLQQILKSLPAARLSCAEAYKKFVNIDPHLATVPELAERANQLINFTSDLPDRNAWLELLFTHSIAPHLGNDRPVFLYDFPVSQAALAKIRPGNPPVASRFEVYFKGIELANGFHELQDANEQRARFEKDLQYREQHKLPNVGVDENFLGALQHGIPDCAGVALGVDRLIMLALETDVLAEVMSFTFDHA